jgi:asparagine synthase (glutamine-hydrolysing)
VCGLVGIATSEKADVAHWVAKSLDRMTCRGPDGRGVKEIASNGQRIILGHNRLSIFDLSQNGIQPMESGSGRFTIVFNGEIYNFLELGELINGGASTLRTKTDTEVLLELWEQKGQAALDLIEGMFSFAIFDSLENRLTLVRDQFGIKPLYYLSDKGLFAFSSTPDPLWGLLSAPSLNESTLLSFLAEERYDLGADTFVAGVLAVRPGELLSVQFDEGICVESRRWYRTSFVESKLSESESEARLRTLLRRSVDLHMRSDAPIAFALSGGIDSSALVCIARDLFPNRELSVFVYAPEGFEKSEEKWAEIVSSHVGAKVHLVRPSAADVLASLDDLIRLQGEPIDNPRFIAQYFVFREAARAGFKVVIEGQGADEVFAGYLGYPNVVFLDRLKRNGWVDALTFAINASKLPGRSLMNILSSVFYRLVKGFIGDDLRVRAKLAIYGTSVHQVRRLLNLEGVRVSKGALSQRPSWISDVRGNLRRELVGDAFFALLPKLLRHGDRNAMAHSVENRVPFLHQPLAEFALSMPPEYMVSSHGESKSLLRKSLEGTVPQQILRRMDKIGFQTPEDDYLRLLYDRHRNVPSSWKPALKIRTLLLLEWLKFFKEATE